MTTQIVNDLFLTENRPEWSEIIGSDVVDLSGIIRNNRGQTDAESVTFPTLMSILCLLIKTAVRFEISRI